MVSHLIRGLVGVVLVPALGFAQPPLTVPNGAPDRAANFEIVLRSRLARAMVEQTVARPESIHTRTGRTQVSGSGETAAVVGLELVPCADAAVLDLVVNGNTTSQTVVARGPVQVFNSNLTTFAARKRVIMDANGFRALPATARAGQDTELEGIATPFRCPLDSLVRSATYRVYLRQRDRVLERTAREVAGKLAGTVDSTVDPQIASASRSYDQDLVTPLRRRNLFPESLRFSSEVGGIRIRGALGSPTGVPPPPAFDPASDLWIRVHESVLNTAAVRVLGGKTFTPETFANEFTDLPGVRSSKPKAEDLPPGPERLEMTFARDGPIETRFGKGTATITLRFTKFNADDVEHEGMNITASYRLQRGGDGVYLAREKDLIIVPPGYVPGQRLSFRQIQLRTLLRRRFADLFKERLDIDPPSLKLAADKVIRLKISAAEISGEWFVINYSLEK
jgi:hypothetical protein